MSAGLGWLRLEAPLGRKPFFLWSAALFAVKHALDRFLAGHVFGQSWELWDYVAPLRMPPATWPATRFYGVLLLISLPFIAAGVLLTIRRLRDAGLPLILVALVFIPFVKLIFFVFLSSARVASNSHGRITGRPAANSGFPHRASAVQRLPC